jgi:DNA-binding protein HU-beta
MNKRELTQFVAKTTKLSETQAGKTINAVLEGIKKALGKGESVSLVGFGSFGVRKRAARSGRNPRTGKPLKIPAAKVPVFRPGKGLKEVVKGKSGK